jgi:xylan 1,4-beta-xylosidase
LSGKNYANGSIGTPLDFISFHAKGAPRFVDGHVQMGIANQLQAINQGFAIIASYPQLKNKPIVIGESDPDGCAACQGAQLGYRNSTMYSSYTAASFAREFKLAEKYGVNLEGALTWAFEFEEQPYFAGFRALATNGIDLPVLNVFRMFSKLNGHRLKVKSDGEIPLESIVKDGVRDRPDVSAFSSVDKNKLYVLAWHYHDDDLPGPDANVQINLTGLPVRSGVFRVLQYRIDSTNSNAFAAWQRMGSPQRPSAQQYRELERAGQLTELASSKVKIQNSAGHIDLVLPRQAVTLVVLEF